MNRTRFTALASALRRHASALAVASVVVVSGGVGVLAATGAGDADGSTSLLLASGSAAASTVETSAVTPTATPPTTSPAPSVSGDPVVLSDNAGGAGGNNIVGVTNYIDGRLAMKGSIQINRINAPNVAPQNIARAFSSCVDCQSLAVAMQVNLIRSDTQRVVPGNAAVAVNVACTRCVTVAVALQYTLSVSDPMKTPLSVRHLVRDMDSELRAISREATTLSEAIDRINAVIERYQALKQSLSDRRDVATESTQPGASPELTPTPTLSSLPTDVATPSASPSAITSSGPMAPSPSATP